MLRRCAGRLAEMNLGARLRREADRARAGAVLEEAFHRDVVPLLDEAAKAGEGGTRLRINSDIEGIEERLVDRLAQERLAARDCSYVRESIPPTEVREIEVEWGVSDPGTLTVG